MTRRNDRRLALLAGGGLALLFTMIAAVQVAAWSVGKVENSSHRVLTGSVDELFIESQNGDVTVIRSVDGKVRIDGRSEGHVARARRRRSTSTARACTSPPTARSGASASATPRSSSRCRPRRA